MRLKAAIDLHVQLAAQRYPHTGPYFVITVSGMVRLPKQGKQLFDHVRIQLVIVDEHNLVEAHIQQPDG
jgi:hypothetical protein